MGGRQRTRTPIAVRRIQHERLLGALLEPVPQLDEMEPALYALADPDRNLGSPPEVRQYVSDELPLHGLVQRDPPRLELAGQVAAHLAIPEVGSCAVDRDGADIGRVNCLDGEAARRRGDESQVDVVLLGAQRRLAGIDDVDRKLLRGRPRRGGKYQRQARDANDAEQCGLITPAPHRHLRNWPRAAARRASARFPPRYASFHGRAVGSPPAPPRSGHSRARRSARGPRGRPRAEWW